MSISAMKLALDALDLAKRSHGVMLLSDPPQEAWKFYRVDDAIKKSTTALRQAIEQAEQAQPVAWRNAAMRVGEDFANKIKQHFGVE